MAYYQVRKRHSDATSLNLENMFLFAASQEIEEDRTGHGCSATMDADLMGVCVSKEGMGNGWMDGWKEGRKEERKVTS